MHPTPLHAPSVTHICSHFLRFLFIFAQPQKLPPGRCVGQCVVWGRFGCTWVWETIKALDSENRHQPGHPPYSKCECTFFHIFLNFCGFSTVDRCRPKNRPGTGVCVRSFRNIAARGENGGGPRRKWTNPTGQGCIRLPCP